MKLKYSQSGRTMMEMLGVLVIIGILSLTSIYFYRVAMNKYRANDTTNELKIVALNLSEQMNRGFSSLTLNEVGDTTRHGYELFAQIMKTYPDYFEIYVDNVPSKVCAEMLRLSWTLPATVNVGIAPYNGNPNICGTDELADPMIYTFHKDLKEGATLTDTERPSSERCHTDNDCKCGTCVDGMCESNCPEGSTCVKSYDDPRYLVCCQKENVANGLCCAVIFGGQCCNMTGQCCPPDRPLRDRDGKCYACDTTQSVIVENVANNCAACPNRLLGKEVWSQRCYLPCGVPGTVNANKPLYDRSYGCHSCDEDNVFVYTAMGSSNCLTACPDRKFTADGYCTKKCKSDKPLLSTNGTCQPCSFEGLVEVSQLDGECATLCPNREVQGKYCQLKCPSDRPLRDKDGKCHACDTTALVNVENVDVNCAACPNRLLGKEKWNQRCYLPCGVPGTVNEDKPLYDRSYGCHSCDEDSVFVYTTIGSSNCLTACPDRKFTADGYCKKSCPPERPLMSTNGTCQACDYEGLVETTLLEKECATLCPNREVQGKYCQLKCPSDRPLRDQNGRCYACDTLSPVAVVGVSENCAVCPDRKLGLYGQQCYLPCGVPGTANENKPLYDSGYKCHDCDVKSIPIFTADTNCLTACSNRELSGNSCLRKTCSVQYPLEGIDAVCYPCNISTPIDVNGDKTKCDKCINRKMQGNYCILI